MAEIITVHLRGTQIISETLCFIWFNSCHLFRLFSPYDWGGSGKWSCSTWVNVFLLKTQIKNDNISGLPQPCRKVSQFLPDWKCWIPTQHLGFYLVHSTMILKSFLDKCIYVSGWILHLWDLYDSLNFVRLLWAMIKKLPNDYSSTKSIATVLRILQYEIIRWTWTFSYQFNFGQVGRSGQVRTRQMQPLTRIIVTSKHLLEPHTCFKGSLFGHGSNKKKGWKLIWSKWTYFLRIGAVCHISRARLETLWITDILQRHEVCGIWMVVLEL